MKFPHCGPERLRICYSRNIFTNRSPKTLGQSANRYRELGQCELPLAAWAECEPPLRIVIGRLDRERIKYCWKFGHSANRHRKLGKSANYHWELGQGANCNWELGQSANYHCTMLQKLSNVK